MSVSHHLDESTLMAYAAGELSEAFRVVAAAHLAMCEDCRAAARTAEAAGGALLDALDTSALDVDAFARLMAGIDAAPDSQNQPIRVRRAASDVPAPLQHYIGTVLDNVKWRPVAPGVRKHAIRTAEKDSTLYMLHIADGMAVPEHGHGGMEMTLILSGAYRDVFGTFATGDIADLDEHVEHQPKVVPGAPCICLVATEAPTRFRGRIARLLQPLVGI